MNRYRVEMFAAGRLVATGYASEWYRWAAWVEARSQPQFRAAMAEADRRGADITWDATRVQ